MDIVVTSPTEQQTNAISKQVAAAFPKSSICQFTDSLFAVQFIYNHHADMVFADAEIKKPLDEAKFIHVLRKQQPEIDITIISDDERYRRFAEEAGANFFTGYDKLNEVLNEHYHCGDR